MAAVGRAGTAANGAASAAAAPAEVLRQVFGFPEFRGLQRPVIDAVVAGGDALVLMPTGGGKSICYQVPALCRPGLAVVVSPLIALMDDQVASLRQVGVEAGALHSEAEPAEQRRVQAALSDGRLKLLYVSPERLLMPGTLDRVGRKELALFAIDEAHCVSAWGHEFRPEYRALAQLGHRYPGVPRVALTGTADPRTRDDILRSLDMGGAEVFVASFHRPNLHIAARAKEGETAELRAFLTCRQGQAGIVYCGSRAKTERVATRLKERNLPAVPYHAGLSPMEKRVALARFRSGEPLVVVATIAFGMGIDRPDVRYVVHLDMPDSPEAYYQQIGRAGRDSQRADTLLLYGGEDIARARHWLAQSAAAPQQKRVMQARLEAMIALTETAECRTRTLLASFGEELGRPCGHCDNCTSPVQVFDGTVAAQKVLSAIYRTGQRFGAMHVVSVLRGEANSAAERNGHDRLPTWGIGRDRPAPFWRSVIRQLIARGAIDTTEGEYPVLTLVQEKARPILRNEETLLLRGEAAAEAPWERRTGSGARGGGAGLQATSPDPLDAEADGLLTALKLWRTAEARAQSVPPYVIFHDSVLREIAGLRPTSLDALGQVRGVGASKLDRYGAAILEMVAAAEAA